MSERERLIKLLDQNCGYVEEQKAENIADYLLENGVIVPPVKVGGIVWVIYNKCVTPANVMAVIKIKQSKQLKAELLTS